MKSISLLTSALLLVTPATAFAGSQLQGKWKARSGGGALYLRVSGGKSQLKIVGSCSSAWLTTQPSNAFALESGEVVLKEKRFKVTIGGACTTARVSARAKRGGGFSMNFKNQWKFSGYVK